MPTKRIPKKKTAATQAAALAKQRAEQLHDTELAAASHRRQLKAERQIMIENYAFAQWSHLEEPGVEKMDVSKEEWLLMRSPDHTSEDDLSPTDRKRAADERHHERWAANKRAVKARHAEKGKGHKRSSANGAD